MANEEEDLLMVRQVCLLGPAGLNCFEFCQSQAPKKEPYLQSSLCHFSLLQMRLFCLKRFLKTDPVFRELLNNSSSWMQLNIQVTRSVLHSPSPPSQLTLWRIKGQSGEKNSSNLISASQSGAHCRLPCG